ncbi:type II secretion system F family protein, partial [Candidatus Peregrinibacteria bacterium]|nr:type II secretion system F family protein [Candidatus Peregrinibacteria bacterium]
MDDQIKKIGLEGQQNAYNLNVKQGEPAQKTDITEVDASAPILLNISATSVQKKLLELEKLKAVKVTGNPIIDAFYRINDYLISLAKISVSKKAAFFRLLSVMINAGVPLVKSLDTLAEQNSKDLKFGRIIYDLGRKVEAGKSLSDAMKMHSDVFEEAQIGMVKSGEASGQLTKTLSNVASQLEKSASFRSKLRGAMIYPITILCVLIGVIFALMVFVIPGMKDFFGQMGQDLPGITKFVIGASDFFVAYWYILIGAIIGVIGLINIWKKTADGKLTWDSMMLRIPLIGGLIKKSILAQMSRSFSDLIGAGIPLINAIKITANSLNNGVYKRKLMMAAKDVEQGITLAEALTDPALMPTMLTDMIAIGEQTAQIETVTEKVAAFYEE